MTTGLYHVGCYCHRLNEWGRVVVSAENSVEAQMKAIEVFPGYKPKTITYICETDRQVCQEV